MSSKLGYEPIQSAAFLKYLQTSQGGDELLTHLAVHPAGAHQMEIGTGAAILVAAYLCPNPHLTIIICLQKFNCQGAGAKSLHYIFP